MATQPKKGVGGAKASRTETVSIRLDPKLRYLAELAARKHRRSLSSYIEWAIGESLKSVIVYEGSGYNGDDPLSLEEVSSELWDIDEAERFIRLALRYPELLSIDEQERWKMLSDSGLLAPAQQRDLQGRTSIRHDILTDTVYPVVRQHWQSLLDAHTAGGNEMRAWVDDMRKKVSSFQVYPNSAFRANPKSPLLDSDDIPF